MIIGSIISLRARGVVLSSSPIYGGLDLRKEVMGIGDENVYI